MIRQYRVYEQPLLAQFETWTSRMSGALRRQLFIQVKKRYGCLFLWLLSFGHAKESNTPLGRNQSWKYQLTSTSEDEPITPTSIQIKLHLRTLQHIIHIHILRDLKSIHQRTIFHTTQIITM